MSVRLVRVGHFALQGFELVVQIADPSAAAIGFIQDRTALHFLDVLAKVADRQLPGDRDRAPRREFPRRPPYERAFVLPDPLGPTSPTFSPGFN